MSAIVDGTSQGPSAESRLEESRSELRELFVEPEQSQLGEARFPRSRLMRHLTGTQGMAWLAVGAGGLLLARPRLLMRVLRMVPVTAIARMLALKFFARKI